MERLLGVAEAEKRMEQDVNELLENDQIGKSDRPDSHRYDVEEADLQDEVEGNNRARQRYQRLFWESVAEGEVRDFGCSFTPVIIDDCSRNRSCPIFLRPNEVLPWRVRNLEVRQRSLSARQVDLPSCSLMSAMLSSTRRKENDGNARALGDLP